jgi:hypothetical protein
MAEAQRLSAMAEDKTKQAKLLQGSTDMRERAKATMGRMQATAAAEKAGKAEALWKKLEQARAKGLERASQAAAAAVAAAEAVAAAPPPPPPPKPAPAPAGSTSGNGNGNGKAAVKEAEDDGFDVLGMGASCEVTLLTKLRGAVDVVLSMSAVSAPPGEGRSSGPADRAVWRDCEHTLLCIAHLLPPHFQGASADGGTEAGRVADGAGLSCGGKSGGMGSSCAGIGNSSACTGVVSTMGRSSAMGQSSANGGAGGGGPGQASGGGGPLLTSAELNTYRLVATTVQSTFNWAACQGTSGEFGTVMLARRMSDNKLVAVSLEAV